MSLRLCYSDGMSARWACVVALSLATGCVGSGEVETTISGEIVGLDDRPLGPGLAIFELGEVHEGRWNYGTIISETGRWTTPDLGEGGTFGIHLFHDEYSYLPAEVTIDEHQQVVMTSLQIAWGDWLDRTGEPTWPNQPDDATIVRMPGDDNAGDNPILHSVTMEYLDDELMRITAEVSDPDGDLSRMILGHDTASGGGFAFNPPTPPEGGNFPDGTYTVTVSIDERHVPGETPFLFVVSDNLCNNSPILELTMPAR